MTSEETYAEAVQDATAKLRDLNEQLRGHSPAQAVPFVGPSCPLVARHSRCLRQLVRDEMAASRAERVFDAVLFFAIVGTIVYAGSKLLEGGAK